MNILIVEPSKIFQLALERIFRVYATNVFMAISGTEALDLYSKIKRS